jgi:hypothetical protein
VNVSGSSAVIAALDRMARERRRPPAREPSVCPAAMRICSRTRSTPVIASVTGCSTCRRVFISMKAELAVLVQELDRAGAAIAELGQTASATIAADARRARAAVRAGEAGLLEHLLVAPLQRAVALAEMHDVAVAVGRSPGISICRGLSRYFSM